MKPSLWSGFVWEKNNLVQSEGQGISDNCELSLWMYLNQSKWIFQPSCLSVCFQFHSVCPCVQQLTPVFAVGSQNITNKSFLVCVKSEKYAYSVTLRPLGFMRQGEAKIQRLWFRARRSRAVYSITCISVHHLPRVGPKQLCALAHLGCTRVADTS